ncbi:superoxide dismutase family protein [Luteimonas sp. A277]
MRFLLTVSAVAALLSACSSTPDPRPLPVAVPEPVEFAQAGTFAAATANLASASGSLVSGQVRLRAESGTVRVTGEVGGLVPHGAHGLQVHEKGDCSAADASTAGPFFDPLEGYAQRGAVTGTPGRIFADARGVAQVDLLIPGAVLGGGSANDINGRALLVLGATPGAFSARVACGEIVAGQ